MKAMIPMNDYGIMADKNNTARVDSRFVAQFFEKNHKEVLRDIRKVVSTDSGLSEEFTKLNFALSEYRDTTGRKLPCYLLTRDGFTILAMGYTGPKAMKFKELYIKKFNEMEDFITTLISAREMFPILTENISLIHDHPKAYHYSNECDMINRLVLGMSAKQVRELYGIEKGQSIRPYLTSGQMYLIDRLQKIDAGLLISTPDYQARKRQLEWYLTKISKEADYE
ncbi:phage regulatory protein, rha family [Peptostreptococcaceae bacterium pGA-8]|nr:phage regulatory protein, rha family [Peptostreptococcaceae bacterium pGA-8]